MSTDPSAMHAATPRRLVVLTCGGTISCTTDPTGVLVPTIGAATLTADLPGAFARAGQQVEILSEEVMLIDSAAMTSQDMADLHAAVQRHLADPTVTGIVITHGTDSLEETALYLDFGHNDPRPVVLTGAQYPADADNSDGYANLVDAAVIAADPSAREMGVLVVFGRAVLPARGVMKWHTTDTLAFATTAGEEPHRPTPLVPLPRLDGITVEIIASWAGASGAAITAAVAAGAQGLIIDGMGSGNVGIAQAQAVAAARAAGVEVVMTTRVPRGGVAGTYGGAGGGATLAALGVIGGGYLHAPQARIALATLLAAGAQSEEIAAYFAA